MPLVAYLIPAAGAAALLAAWCVLIEPRWFRVRRVGLPAESVGLPPLRILHLTDLHLHGRDKAKLRFLRWLAREGQYDLVLFTGDLIHGPRGLPAVRKAAELFQPRLGSFAVLGGHDHLHVGALATYWHLLTGTRPGRSCRRNPADRVVEALELAGVTVLCDGHAFVDDNRAGRFALVGLSDAYLSRPDFERAWDGLEAETATVVFAHSPDVLPEAARRGADLALFGHTHGGQVRLPLLGALVTRSRLPRRAARGAFRCGSAIAVVNSGLGTAPSTPFRFMCRPEAVVVEIRPDLSALPAVEELDTGTR